jgi:hypothetical protein
MKKIRNWPHVRGVTYRSTAAHHGTLMLPCIGGPLREEEGDNSPRSATAQLEWCDAPHTKKRKVTISQFSAGEEGLHWGWLQVKSRWIFLSWGSRAVFSTVWVAVDISVEC